METKGLLEKPKFDNPDYYLTSGPRTEVTDRIRSFAARAEGNTDLEIANSLLNLMAEEIEATRLSPDGEFKTYQKTADYILQTKLRTSYVDSATLFAALLRARNIPAMQIMTLCVPQAIRDPEWFAFGDMYVAAYLKDEEGNGIWQVVEPDVGKATLPWHKFEELNLEDRNIEPAEYAYAYTRDYGELDYRGRKFNSYRMWAELQRLFFKKCNKYDMAYVQKLLKEQEERRKQEEEKQRSLKEKVAMYREGLVNSPRFDNPEFYLTSGIRTAAGDLVENLAARAIGETREDIAIDLLRKMNTVTKRLENAHDDPRKFKRNAEEILESEERTGCTDSSTLYTALLRARGIPAMQIIANNVPRALEDPENFTYSHFFTAALLEDEEGATVWKIIDSDVSDETIDKKAHFTVLNQGDRNIDRHHYAFAYTRDYGDILAYGKKIESVSAMLDIQREAFARSDKNDMVLYKERQAKRRKTDIDDGER